MSTHLAIVTAAPRAPLETRQVPTLHPEVGEVRVKTEWASAGPLELHQADGGLLVNHPQILGDAISGTVVEFGPGVSALAIGDKVFGFTFRSAKEKAYQEYPIVPTNMLGKIPGNVSMPEAVVIPTNLVTIFHTLTTDLEIPLPWPKPAGYRPATDQPILIWGGSSSVGQYAIQVLKYYGHSKIIAVASKRQHGLLTSLGASSTFDYNEPDIVDKLRDVGQIPLILDCIGSQKNSLGPIAKVAQAGSKVAIMLPVIIRDASETVGPEYTMDVLEAAKWVEGVDARGVRTHFYQQNAFFAEKLQSEIMPTLVGQGIIKPNKIRVVEGSSTLARAQAALDALRRKEVSGEKLVWRFRDE